MAETCILVDEKDRVIGSTAKRNCHQASTIVRGGGLHRAFSVFLFNSAGEMLLQQRSKEKLTFPSCWTNTCCSHPLHGTWEMEEDNALGVKKAAQRKLEHELGIPKGAILVDEFVLLTRIYYTALQGNEWGEHEIDYVLFAQKDVELAPSANEVGATRYVSPDELRAFMAESRRAGDDTRVSPWFSHIEETFLYDWWADLPGILKRGGLENKTQASTIHRLGVPLQFIKDP